MTTEEFVRELAKCAPDIETLIRKDGASAEFAKEYRNMFFCKPKSDGYRLDDPLLNLLSLYDVSHVEIGLVRFFGQPGKIDEGWIVAEAEVDPVILDERTQEIYVEEDGEPGHILWKCARNSGRFLAALVEAACFLRTRTIQENEKDRKERDTQANRCAEIAGGEPYLNFYRMLLGWY